MAVRAQIRCRAALPDPVIKEQEWERYNSAEAKDSIVNLSASMDGFLWGSQLGITQKYIEKWLDGLLAYSKKFERERTEHFHDYLVPSNYLAE